LAFRGALRFALRDRCPDVRINFSPARRGFILG
jgi:hypothetical protein